MRLDLIKKRIRPVLNRRGVFKAALFGSAVRGEMRRGSDIDLLIDLKEGGTLMDFVGLKLELEEKLDRKVDLVEYAAIKPSLRALIFGEQKIIYEKKRP